MKEIKEKIEEISKEIEAIELNWQHLLGYAQKGFQETYGIIPRGIPLNDLGISNEYKDYIRNISNLKEKMKYHINECLHDISKIISIHNIKPDNIVDYRVPFDYFLSFEEMLNSNLKTTTEDQIHAYLISFEDDYTLNERVQNLKGELFFFNYFDVIIQKNGRAGYINEINSAKKNLKNLNYFDKNGAISIIGKVIKNRFDHFSTLNQYLSDKNTGLPIKGISYNGLINLYFDFMNTQASQKVKALEILDAQENLSRNLETLENFQTKLNSL